MLDPVVGFFLLGLIARLGRSDLRIPEALYEALSIYLLLAIGLKGGLQLAQQPLAQVWPVAAAAMLWSALIPLLLIPVLRVLVRLDGINASAVAAHYGSVAVSYTHRTRPTTICVRILYPCRPINKQHTRRDT